MIRPSTTALFLIVIAAMCVTCLADLVREGQIAFAISAVLLPIVVGCLAGSPAFRRKRGRPAAPMSAEASAVLERLDPADQDRISRLAASGDEIRAIRALREVVPVGLRAAKDVVDGLAALNRREP